MNKEEALAKIKELQEFVEDLDKKCPVMVYIKKDAEEIVRKTNGWTVSMDSMPGNVFEAYELAGDTLRVWNGDKSTYWNFAKDAVVVVEGSLGDLKK